MPETTPIVEKKEIVITHIAVRDGGVWIVINNGKKEWLCPLPGEVTGKIRLEILELLTKKGCNVFGNKQTVVERIEKEIKKEKEEEEKKQKKKEKTQVKKNTHREIDRKKEDSNEPPQNFDARLKKNLISYLDLLQISEEFAEKIGVIYDEHRIWWLWDEEKNYWRMTDETAIMNCVDSQLHYSSETLKSNVKSEILEALKRAGRKNKPKELTPFQIQFSNTIVDIETGETFPATNKFFTINPIPHKLGKSEETPKIDKLFTEWVGEENKISLYEMVSFCLAKIYFIHRCFCLIGTGRNGKDCLQNLLANCLGENNVCSADLDALSKEPRFQKQSFYKKLACVMGETNFNVLDKTSTFKTLTGQSLMWIEFKGKDGFGNRNYAKILIATNSLPITADKTEGFYRRWFIIDFPNKFPEGKDVLKNIPEEEYENLCYKCTKILNGLIQTGGFTKEGSIADRKKSYEEHSNPVNKFISENYVKDINEKTAFYVFNEELAVYLQEREYRGLGKKEVSRLVKDLGFEIRRDNVKKPDGNYTSWHFIFGLRKKQGLEKYTENQEIRQKTDNTDNTNNTVVPVAPIRIGETGNTVLSVLSVLNQTSSEGTFAKRSKTDFCYITPNSEKTVEKTEKNSENSEKNAKNGEKTAKIDEKQVKNTEISQKNTKKCELCGSFVEKTYVLKRGAGFLECCKPCILREEQLDKGQEVD